ncbi:MAG: helicase-associated domain-containing protein [Candidatus Poribacteria bacterium]|nr:helicase-associated domain-containing protein [Candidatus Poribacteria bacterium]
MPRRSSQTPQTLSDFLTDSYTVSRLKKLAALVAKGLPTRKAELITVIEGVMRDPEKLRAHWGKLDTLQQAAVSETLYAESLTFDADGFRAKYGKDPGWGALRDYGEGNPSRLWLFIHQNHLPRDLAQRLKPFVPPPKTTQIECVAELPQNVTLSWEQYDYSSRKRQIVTEDVSLYICDTERTAQHDLLAILRLIDVGKVRVSEKTQRVTQAGARAITEVLAGGDFYEPTESKDPWETEPGAMKAFAWPLILQAARLASSSSGKLQLTSAGKKALTAIAPKTLRTAWDRWLKTTLLDELNRVNAIKGQTGKGKRNLTAVSQRRATIVEALKECPPHRWMTFSAFSRFMRAAGHRFAVTRNAWTLYIAEVHYGSLGDEGFGGWNILQERYMMAFLFEYAATMGLIDVAYIHPSGARRDHHELWGTDDLDCLSRYDGLMYLRINALGAWCLGMVDEYVAQAVEERLVLKVLPNRDIVATEPLSAGDALFLDQFAAQTSEGVWKLDEKKLVRMLEDGHAVKDVEAFLKARSGGELPQNVAVFLGDTHTRASQLTAVGPALLIAVTDASLAKQFAHERSLRSLCMLAGENHLVVPSEKETAFRRALRKLGYALPAGQVK